MFTSKPRSVEFERLACGFRRLAGTLAIGGSVAACSVGLEHAAIWRALLLGLAATVVQWFIHDGGPLGVRRTISPAAVGFVVVALSVGSDVAGFGLEPLHALVAVSIAGGVMILTNGKRSGHFADRILVVGSGYAARALIVALESDARTEFIGQIDDSDEDGLLGGLDELASVAEDFGITTVIFAYSYASDARLAELAAHCRERDLVVGIVPRLFEEFDQRLCVRRSCGMPLLVVEPWRYQTRMPILTRVADVAAACVLLVATLPLSIVIATAIVAEERGPVLYRARRIGQHGEPFDMLKFRKMRRDAGGPNLTVADDARFTRVGGFLARTKLDELPQLINVLRGEMALVGPRPEDSFHVSLFRDEFSEILAIRPGITGLSQIQYRNESVLLVGDDFGDFYRNELLPRKIDLDRYYARRRSLWLDLRIVAWTFVAIVAGARIQRNELTAAVSFERCPADEIESESVALPSIV